MVVDEGRQYDTSQTLLTISFFVVCCISELASQRVMVKGIAWSNVYISNGSGNTEFTSNSFSFFSYFFVKQSISIYRDSFSQNYEKST